MPSSFKYRAFISYSHRDAKWATWLHRGLERYIVPKGAFAEEGGLEVGRVKKSRRLTPIFRDRDELPASGSLSDTIQQALESSENLIVLCSLNSAASQYVNAEIKTFRGLHSDNEKKVYALIVEGEPPECFPPALVAGGAEPIAADARQEGDGKADAKLKLIAGMLGVGFDRLKQREAKRQRSRLIAMVAVVSAVAVMASALALWALKAEKEAHKQRAQAEEQRELAMRSASEAKAVLHFFETRIVTAARPKELAGGLGIDATIYEAIEAAEPQIGKIFADQPLVEASIRYTMGNTYLYLGQEDLAILQHERALGLREEELSIEDSKTLNSMSSLATSYWKAGRNKEALALREKTLELKRKVLGSEHPTTLLSMNDLATSYKAANRFKEAIALHKKALGLQQKVMGPKHLSTLASMANLALSYSKSRRYEEALVLNKETLELMKEVKGPEHPHTLSLMNNLASSYSETGHHKEALTLREETLKLKIKALGSEHPSTLSSMNNLANSYEKAQLHQEALALHKKTLELRKKALPPGHPSTLNSMKNLAISYIATGDNESALDLRKDLLELMKKALGSKHPKTLLAMSSLAFSYWENRQLEDAEVQYREYIAVLNKQAANDWRFFYAQSSLGAVLTEKKQYIEAESLLLAGHRGLESGGQKNESKWLLISTKHLVALYKAWNKPEKAAQWQTKLSAKIGSQNQSKGFKK